MKRIRFPLSFVDLSQREMETVAISLIARFDEQIEQKSQ